MRTKKALLLTGLIAFSVILYIFVNSFLVPALRSYRARLFPVSEYDRSEYDSIVMAAYPSFNISIFDLIDVSCDERGYLYLEYIRNREHALPMSPDVFHGLDGDYDYLYIFRYDPLWNRIYSISRNIPN